MGKQLQKILCVGAIIIGCIAALLILVSKLLQENIPNVLVLKDIELEFDYVVVGAGTAGATLTSLLAKHSNGSVLLVEAGGSFGLLSRIPLLTTFQQKGVNDWSFLSVPQKHSSKGLVENRQSLPRGKGLGGSANLNYMLHFDGHPPDFDYWHSLQNLSKWTWDDMRPFLAAAKPKKVDLYEIPRDYSMLSQAIEESQEEFSHQPWHFRRSVYNVKNGLRHSVLHQFLLPVINNLNLRLLPQALVKLINLSSTGTRKATSIIVGLKNEQNKEVELKINVRRELLLCAGAYQTPQLLLASGIGDIKVLKQLKLPVQHHLPLVGQGLHDHFNVPLYVSIGTIGPTLNQRTMLSPINIINYLGSGTGAYGNFGVLGQVASYKEPLPFAITFFGAGAIDESALMSLSNFKRSSFRALFPRYHNASQEGFVVISNCLQPKSRGTVMLLSKNMRRNPLIDPNYLSNGEDVTCTLQAMRNAIKVVTSSAFAKMQPRIHWPKIQECANFGPFDRDFGEHHPSDHYLECLMRHIGLGSHHPGGSCSLGAVVDSHLRLHGIANVRVVDASVLPRPISGNPNSVITAIAIRAASWILKNELQDNLV